MTLCALGSSLLYIGRYVKAECVPVVHCIQSCASWPLVIESDRPQLHVMAYACVLCPHLCQSITVFYSSAAWHWLSCARVWVFSQYKALFSENRSQRCPHPFGSLIHWAALADRLSLAVITYFVPAHMWLSVCGSLSSSVMPKLLIYLMCAFPPQVCERWLWLSRWEMPR